MAKEKRNKKRIRLPMSAYLIYLLVATLMFTGASFSSYVTNSEDGDSARVAAFRIHMDGDENGNLEINCNNPKGTFEAAYDFSVQNYTADDDVCEVALSYVLKVTLPLEVEGLELKLQDEDDSTITGTQNGNVYTWQAEDMKFEAGVMDTHAYTLTFNAYDVDEQGKQMDLSEIKVAAVVEQVD